MKTIANLLFLFGFSLLTIGQDLPFYSQYMLNPYLLNPSMTGMSHDGMLQTTNRIQWTNVEDAPRSNSISYQQGFKRYAWGGQVYSDRNGLNSEIGIQGSMARHYNLGDRLSKDVKGFSYGFSLNAFQHSIDESKFTKGEYDPAVTGIMQSQRSLNVSTGVSFVNKRFFAGYSVTNLIPLTFKKLYGDSEPRLRPNHFLLAGYSVAVQKQASIEPSFVLKYIKELPPQLDINLKAKFIEKEYALWLALSFRQVFEQQRQQSLSFMPLIGYETDRFSFGYAYDFGLSGIQTHYSGSHEIFVGYKLYDKDACTTCPAYKNSK